MTREQALAFLRDAAVVRLASTNDSGEPVLRTLHPALLDGWICFHGAVAGEKTEAIGKQAVIAADEPVASLPSFWREPEKACPATTWYLGVQVHGAIERVDDPDFKARSLQALMEKLQPEGGHKPITALDPLYKASVRGTLVLRVSTERIDGKAKLGQNLPPETLAEMWTRLWQRGSLSDLRAIELSRAASPSVPDPEFLRAPEGLRLHLLGPRDVDEAVALLRDAYWNVGQRREVIAASHLGSSAWVGARDASGRLVGTARAYSDLAKHARIQDVVVHPDLRGRGAGKALMRLVLDHPAVRRCGTVYLSTRDAQTLYARFGFVEDDDRSSPVWPFTRMVLRR